MSFVHLLTDSVWVASPTGVSDFGEQTYGPVREVACALEGGHTRVMNTDGDEVIAALSLASNEEITQDDVVWFSLADSGDPALGRQPTAVGHCKSRNSTLQLFEAFF